VPISIILLDDKNGESYPKYATELFDRIFDAQAMVHENLNQAKIRSKQHYDRKANPHVFKKDMYVYLLKELMKGKFDKYYTGPYKNIETLKSYLKFNNIKIGINDKKVKIVQSDKLKICKTRPTEQP